MANSPAATPPSVPDAAPAAKPAAPAETPKPNVTPVPSLDERMASFKEVGDTVKPAPKPESKPVQEASKEPVAEPKKTDAKTEDDPVLKGPPPQLRKAYLDKHAALTKALADLEAKSKRESELASELERFKTAKPDDSKIKELTEAQTILQKKIEDLNSKLAGTNFTETEEYREQYEAPLKALLEQVREDIKSITVTPESGDVRLGNWDDVADVLAMPIGKAMQVAQERFGVAAPYILQMRVQYQQLEKKSRDAIAKASSDWSERQKLAKANLDRQAMEAEQLYSGAIQKLATTDDFFKVDENDKETAGLLTGELSKVDTFLRNPSALPPQEAAEQLATIRWRAGAYPRVVKDNQKLRDQVKQLQEEIKLLSDAEPGGGTDQQPAKTSTREQAMDDALAKVFKK